MVNLIHLKGPPSPASQERIIRFTASASSARSTPRWRTAGTPGTVQATEAVVDNSSNKVIHHIIKY